jgi:hypothetical protein
MIVDEFPLLNFHTDILVEVVSRINSSSILRCMTMTCSALNTLRKEIWEHHWRNVLRWKRLCSSYFCITIYNSYENIENCLYHTKEVNRDNVFSCCDKYFGYPGCSKRFHDGLTIGVLIEGYSSKKGDFECCKTLFRMINYLKKEKMKAEKQGISETKRREEDIRLDRLWNNRQRG